jgi:hypothetical protein
MDGVEWNGSEGKETEGGETADAGKSAKLNASNECRLWERKKR